MIFFTFCDKRLCLFFFFFQAEDGIRGFHVTGVQTCALPISPTRCSRLRYRETAMSFLSSRTRSAREGFGKPILRKEDARLLVGGGCYSDDVNLPGQAYACFVRS